MTEQNIERVFAEICARLPYGVKITTEIWDEDTLTESEATLKVYSVNADRYVYVNTDEETIQLYADNVTMLLRPMDDMTEKEKAEYIGLFDGMPFCPEPQKQIQWLTAHHFDYNGLIEDGLAEKAPIGVYHVE
jgi:hypothetical protein